LKASQSSGSATVSQPFSVRSASYLTRVPPADGSKVIRSSETTLAFSPWQAARCEAV
jgi:hypothetical protein